MTSIVPSDWTSTTLDSLANVVMGSSPLSSSYNEEQDGLPLIQGNADIKDRKSVPRVYTSTPTQVCVDGDILLTVRAPVGYVAKATLKACLGRGVCAITPTNIDSDYLYQALLGQEPKWGALEQGSTFKAINRDDVTKLLVLRPPLQEQKKIAKILTTVDKKLNNIEKKIAATQQLKKGLMQKLFSQGAGIPIEDADGKITWQPHTEFEKSELGLIPKGWEVLSLENIAAISRGRFSPRPRNDPRYYGGVYPFVQTGDVTRSNVYLGEYKQTLNEAGLKVSKLFPKDTILMTIAANIGDVALSRYPVACPDSLVGIIANESICLPKWLIYALSLKKAELESRATQNAQKNINLQVINPLELAVPSLLEQERIASVLTSIDDKLVHLKLEQEKSEILKKGLMQKLLTGQWRVQIDQEEAS